MHDPYRMIFVNIISSILLITGISIYKYLNPRKHINLFVILILISILPVINIFRPGTYESGDFNIHIYRSIEFYRSLSEGNIIPSWAGEVNATYGLPLFIFNYTLPYYIISLFHFLGFSFINSLKLFLAGSYILSGIFMFMLTKKLFKNAVFALTSSVFYLFAPYHLISLHFKVVIGELLAFTIIPLLFFFIIKIRENKQNIKSVALAGLTFAALVASHVFIALAAGIMVVIYSLFISVKAIDNKLFLKTLIALFIGALVSAYIWLVPFFMSQYTIIQRSELNFVPIENISTLFYSPWKLGLLFQGPRGEIADLIGYTQWFVILFLLYVFIIKRNPQKKIVPAVFWLVIFAGLFFMILPVSKFVWELFPFIKTVGQHRLLVVVALVTSILAGYVAAQKDRNKLFIFLLSGLTIFYTILNWGHRRVIPTISDNQLLKEVPFSTYNVDRHFYANSKWVDARNPYFNKIPSSRVEILEGKGVITTSERTSTKHTYHVNAQTNLKIIENTLYFPGWTAKANEKIINVLPSGKGIILINLQKGNYKLEVHYKDILMLRVLKTISMVTLVTILGFLALPYLKTFFRTRRRS